MKQFDHEKLHVYQSAISFVSWSCDRLDQIPKRFSVHNQLDRASTSISLNIAEGNGKFNPSRSMSIFRYRRGSAFECAACLDVAVGKKLLEHETANEGKQMLIEIVSMLVGLIRANSNRTI